jgi:hypothetical protein
MEIGGIRKDQKMWAPPISIPNKERIACKGHSLGNLFR